MTEEEKPFLVGVEVVETLEDGGAKVRFECSHAAKESLIELGFQFIMYCAASKLDIQEALDLILDQIKEVDNAKDMP